MATTKTAQRPDHLRRAFFTYPNARTGFRAFLRALRFTSQERVLLPAYVGWSPREGSGVFDPITEQGLAYDFYPLDDRLHIDLPRLQAQLALGNVKVLVLIHYFGHVDPAYPEAVRLARQYGAWVLEDEAHAMFTDLIGGISGRLGDACIFSLHKMLPMSRGGLLVINPGHEALLETIEPADIRALVDVGNPWEYDFAEIAARRRENALELTRLLQPLAGEIDPLWGDPQPGEVPQTYPVIVRNVSRDQLYKTMNEGNFGVVSLYHTLIEQIEQDEFPQSHWLSRCVTNLPVHQDIEPGELELLVGYLKQAVKLMHEENAA